MTMNNNSYLINLFSLTKLSMNLFVKILTKVQFDDYSTNNTFSQSTQTTLNYRQWKVIRNHSYINLFKITVRNYNMTTLTKNYLLTQ